MESDKLFRFATGHQPWDYSKVCNYTVIILILFQILPPPYNFTFMKQNEDDINSCERKLTVNPGL